MSVGIGRLNPAFGSSRSASSAYQKWPTRRLAFHAQAPSQRAGLLTHLKFENRSDDRFARQDRCGPPPEFPLASPCPGIVHHLRVPSLRSSSTCPAVRARRAGDGSGGWPTSPRTSSTLYEGLIPALTARRGRRRTEDSPPGRRTHRERGPVPPVGRREGARTLPTTRGSGKVGAWGLCKARDRRLRATFARPFLAKPSRSRRTASEEVRPAAAELTAGRRSPPKGSTRTDRADRTRRVESSGRPCGPHPFTS
ncbi:hypothetical protein G5714_024733 [Onychostoma macrolepis]|uniref:Uncharacterized protein n=1 Tax=Onychostoma macrolepis TaxID=369639 RepID=A0A7J6BHF1_9TELE|nr:hypothetical protein G5714_024733 [Onychostoma macrolepis]